MGLLSPNAGAVVAPAVPLFAAAPKGDELEDEFVTPKLNEKAGLLAG